MVHDEHDIEESQEPTESRRARSIKNRVCDLLTRLVVSLGRILVLMVGFTLKIINDIAAENVDNFLADFKIGSIADELVHCSAFPDDVFKGVNEFLVRLHTVDIAYHAFRSHKDLCRCRTIINRGRVGVDGVGGDWFAATVDIESWEARFEVLPEW